MVQLQIHVCTYQIWYSLYEHADTCPFLKVSSTSLLLPLFHHQIFSPSLSSLLLIISKRSPSSCWEQWACMCVNCQYKTALAWAQMKTHSWQGIGEYRLLRCLQMGFFTWRSDYCVYEENLTEPGRLLQKTGYCQHQTTHISGWNRIFKNKLFKYIWLYLPESFSFMHCYTHSIWWAHLSFMRPYLWIHTAVSHKHLTTVILL